jgi:hypothetical protein
MSSRPASKVAALIRPRSPNRPWRACRDTFVVWGVPNAAIVPDIIGPMDCLATKGFVGPMLTGQDTLFSTDVLLAQNECRGAR